MSEIVKVSLLGREHHVVMPDYAAREELMVAYGESAKKGGVALLRVYAAALGLCTRIGRESGADYAKHRFDCLSYGGEVYGWLRGQKVTPAEVAQAAIPVIIAVSQATFPRQDEVDAAAGNSEGGEAS